MLAEAHIALQVMRKLNRPLLSGWLAIHRLHALHAGPAEVPAVAQQSADEGAGVDGWRAPAVHDTADSSVRDAVGRCCRSGTCRNLCSVGRCTTSWWT